MFCVKSYWLNDSSDNDTLVLKTFDDREEAKKYVLSILSQFEGFEYKVSEKRDFVDYVFLHHKGKYLKYEIQGFLIYQINDEIDTIRKFLGFVNEQS